eukprot:TRINITY_DN1353_c0_g2_i6.p1 TRINITY_DN1353_c0_g2~~TRINITY_DN1353_c0_g2_i6.p1  ORF type:complete len:904 (-),score=147.72 TRINITY_DN1353_c0_g2_i6:5828-8449(-)
MANFCYFVLVHKSPLNMNRVHYKVLLYFFVLLLMCLCAPSKLMAQGKYSVFGKVLIENGSIDNTKLTILKNAEKYETKSIENNGKFSCDLDFGNDYILEFSKEGFVTKKVSISTFVPDDVLSRDSQFPPFRFKISLFPAYEGLDMSIFDQPMGMIMYDKEIDDFAYDMEYDAQIRDAINKAKEDARRKAEELEAKRLARERDYNSAIQKGDLNFRAKNYPLAKENYTDALSIKSEEAYPKSQIQKIDDLLAEQQRQAVEEARLAAEQKALDDKYTSILKLADDQFSSGDYSSAKISYSDALALKSEEGYPKSQIQKIDDLLAEQNRQAEEAARLKAESERLAAEKKALESKYASILKLADAQFSSGDYSSAKNSYLDALVLKSEEAYPKNQIQKIDNLLTEQQRQAEEAARQKAESERMAAEQKVLDERYESYIKLADSQFKLQEYSSAKTNYKEALNLKFAEAYPKEQLRKISEILSELERKAKEEAKLLAEQKLNDTKYSQSIAKADKLFSEEVWRSALNEYEKALQLKPSEKYPKERIREIREKLSAEKKREDEKIALRNKYTEIIEVADRMFDEEVYKMALPKYEEALDVIPTETYPKNQIKKIEVILGAQERAEAKEKELQKRYEKEIENGDHFFSQEEYSVSRHHYKTALNLKPKAKYPKEKLNEIDAFLESLKKAEAEFVANNPTNFEKKLSIIKEREYADVISKADEAFNEKEYTVAKVQYERAKSMFERDYPKKQLKEIDKLIKAQKDSKLSYEYKELIARADKELSQGHYSVAKFYYNKALTIDLKNDYPQKQLDKIESLLNSKKNQKVDKEYEQQIKKADRAFENGDYTIARFYYNKAVKLKPSETYPKEKLKTIQTKQRKK